MSQPHILFIDDTPSNLHIAEVYLEDVDCKVFFAGSGRAGIEIAKKYTLDLLFLDLEMPDLDGFETAQAIRDFSTTPIIAMTGHNEADVKARLASNAFNGFLGKPFNYETLMGLITKFTGLEAEVLTVPQEIASAPCSTQHQPVLDILAVNRRLKNNTKLTHKILASFAKNNTHTFKAFCEALDQNEWQTATRICHTLKGGGANIGATKLSEIGGTLEKTCGQRELPTKSQMNELKKQISLTIDACHQHLEEQTPHSATDETQQPHHQAHIKQTLTCILENLECDIGLAQDKLDTLDAQTRDNNDIQEMVVLFNQFELSKLANRIEIYLQSNP